MSYRNFVEAYGSLPAKLDKIIGKRISITLPMGKGTGRALVTFIPEGAGLAPEDFKFITDLIE
jgi:hypothetical protein